MNMLMPGLRCESTVSGETIFSMVAAIPDRPTLQRLSFSACDFEDSAPISDHQQSCGYEEGHSKGPLSHALLVIADF
jgi:hypothetical protein